MRSKIVAVIFFVILLFPGRNCFAQVHIETDRLVVDGLVWGYYHDPSRKLFQKDKQVVLEGTLDKVTIDVYEGGKLFYSTSTNKKGEYRLQLPIGPIYRIELNKSAHTKSVLLIDLKSVPPEIAVHGIRFNSAELVLNSFQSKDTTQANLPFGRLYFDARKKMIDFEPARPKAKSGLFSRAEEPSTSVSLMRRSVIKNKDNVVSDEKYLQTLEDEAKKKSVKKAYISVYNPVVEESTGKLKGRDTAGTSLSEFRLSPNLGISHFTEDKLQLRESEIKEAKGQLEKDKRNAKTSVDSLIILEREALLNAASYELGDAKKLIGLQKKEISTQRNLLLMAICSLVLLFTLLFIIFRNYMGKKKINILLEEKNKKITDSITYAQYIQQSILPQESEIHKLLPQSFIYYQPRDIVSGDFYWLSEIGNKIIVAAVDCTGHGVPGAFMSLIGNTLLSEIINEKHITQPSLILKSLHEGILKSLHQNSDEISCQDGMEMSLCAIDRTNNSIQFAGAMNPVYLIKNKEITVIKPDIQGIGGISSAFRKNIKVKFTDQVIPLEQNMTLYMFTDGYMDQFGGPDNKKFNTSRFKQMLLEVQGMPMSEQQRVVEETMRNWKGKSRQIDDMLVIGLKF